MAYLQSALHAPSETIRHTRKAALISGLGKVPDSYQRQNRGKNHEQPNRSPLDIWILHILLLKDALSHRKMLSSRVRASRAPC